MKYFTKNDNYIKLIPVKYADIEDLDHLLEDESKKRLTDKERLNIELKIFKDEIKKNKYVFELIENRKLLRVELNKVRNHDAYYTAVFDNNIKVKCSTDLFYACKNQDIKFITL